MSFWQFLLYTAISNYIFANVVLLISCLEENNYVSAAWLIFPLIFFSIPIKFLYNTKLKFKKTSCICPLCRTQHSTFNQRINDELGLK
jgi:general stress protein CsbA